MAAFSHVTVNAVRQTMRRRRRRSGKDATNRVAAPRAGHLAGAVRAAGRRS